MCDEHRHDGGCCITDAPVQMCPRLGYSWASTSHPSKAPAAPDAQSGEKPAVAATTTDRKAPPGSGSGDTSWRLHSRPRIVPLFAQRSSTPCSHSPSGDSFGVCPDGDRGGGDDPFRGGGRVPLWGDPLPEYPPPEHPGCGGCSSSRSWAPGCDGRCHRCPSYAGCCRPPRRCLSCRLALSFSASLVLRSLRSPSVSRLLPGLPRAFSLSALTRSAFS